MGFSKKIFLAFWLLIFNGLAIGEVAAPGFSNDPTVVPNKGTVDSLQLVFKEPRSALTISQLRLTKDNRPIVLAGSNIIGSGRVWTIYFPLSGGARVTKVLGNYHLAVLNNAGLSPTVIYWCNTGPVNTAKPTVPRNLAAVPSNNSVSLTWNPPASNRGTAIFQYWAWYKSVQDSDWISFGSPTPQNSQRLVVSGLVNGSDYQFRLTAYNLGGGIGEIAEIQAKAGVAPSSPLMLKETVASGGVYLSWSQPAVGAPITRYEIMQSIDGQNWVNVGQVSNATSYWATGLTNGSWYLFRVVAINSLGSAFTQGNWVQPKGTPGYITGLRADEKPSSVTLTWQAGPDGGQSITDYVIQFSQDRGGSWETVTDGVSTTPSATVSNLGSQIYLFQVAAKNNLGVGPFLQAWVNLTPQAAPDFSMISNELGPEENWFYSLDFSFWTNPYQPNLQFQMDKSSDNGVTWSSVFSNLTSTQFRLDRLMRGERYLFRLAAKRNGIISDYTVKPFQLGNSPTPQILRLVANPDQSVFLYFGCEGRMSGARQCSLPTPAYRIDRAEDALFTTGVINQWAWVTSQSNTYQSTLFDPGKSYYFRVSALTSIPELNRLSPVAGPVGVLGPPSAPRNLTASAGQLSVNLSWDSPLVSGSPVFSYYKVEQFSGGAWRSVTDVISFLRSTTVSNLTGGVQYKFRVSAWNGFGPNQGGPTVETAWVTPSGNSSPGSNPGTNPGPNPSPTPVSEAPSVAFQPGFTEVFDTKESRELPCDPISGQVTPELGSGLCTGNYQAVVSIPYFGSFIYNRNSKEINKGFGMGFDFSAERRILADNLGVTFLQLGDGTRIPLAQIQGVYRASDLRRNRSIFSFTALAATETVPGGTVISYQKTSRSGGYEVEKVQDRFGNTVTFSRDSQGKLNSISDSYGVRVSFQYDNIGLLSSITNRGGSSFSVSITNVGGKKVLSAVSRSDGGSLYRLEFDNLARLTSLTGTNGAIEKISYSKKGNLRAIVNQNNYLTVFTNSSSKVSSRTIFSFQEENFSGGKVQNISSSAGKISFSYDAQGRIESVTPLNRMSYTYTYDCPKVAKTCTTNDIGFHNVKTITRQNGPVTKIQTLDYTCNNSDLLCDVTSYTDEGGIVTTAGYDSLHRVTSKTVNNQTTTFNYQGSSSLEVTNPFGTMNVTFNSDGSIASETDLAGRKMTYGYNQGQIDAITDPYGRVTRLGYDGYGRLTSATGPGGTSWSASGLDDAGRSAGTQTLTVGSLTSSVTSTGDYSSDGKIQSLRTITQVGGANFSQTQFFDPNRGFATRSGVTLSTPTVPTFSVRDSQNKFSRPTAAVPEE